MNKTLRSLLLPTCLLLGSQAAQAELYTIEMLVFSQNGYHAGSQPAHSSPDSAGARSLSAYNGAPLSQFEQLPGASLQLHGDANQLKRNGYEVLYHTGWLQDVRSGQNPKIRIASPDGRVEGVVRVDRGRYLHFRPDLLLSRSASAERASSQYRMNTPRRMRSREVHYLDHPLFGILVVARPAGS